MHNGIMNSLSMEARILRMARMLPTDQTLTDEQREDVLALFKQHTLKHGISLGDASKQMGFSQGVLSQICNGTYVGDIDKFLRMINGWLELDVRKRDASLELPYVPTQLAEEMRAIILAGVARNKIVSIVAPAGSGKTMVLEVLQGETRGFYIYCHEDMGPKVFVEDLCRVMKIKQPQRTIGQMLSQIIERLAGTRRPLFLDEAHRLPRHVFARIRTIHDRAQVPIIIAGTDEILDRIDDRAGAKGQMASRCLVYNAMDYVMDADSPEGKTRGRPLFSIEEIKAVFAKMRIKVDPDAFRLLWGLACLTGDGSLRLVRDLIGTMLTDKKYNPSEAVTRHLVQRAMGLHFCSLGLHLVQKADRVVRAMEKAA